METQSKVALSCAMMVIHGDVLAVFLEEATLVLEMLELNQYVMLYVEMV